MDIGHGVTATLCFLDDTLDTVEYTHTCNGVVGSRDSLPVKPAWRDGWDVLSVEPLTLSPSLLCRVCGHHGFITNGKWVPSP